MNIHLLCPFRRIHLIKTLIHYYGPMNVIFHPICYPDRIEAFKIFQNLNLIWVQPFLCPQTVKQPPFVIAYHKFNCWLDHNKLVPDDYYIFEGDDNMFEPGLVDEVRKQTVDVIFISSFGGDTIPADGSCPHPTGPVCMNGPNDVVLNRCGLGMFFLKGRVQQNIRVDITWSGGDGRLAEKVKMLPSVTYLSTWFVFGNFFQPGRYTTTRGFLRPNWRLPIIYQ